MKLTVIIPVFNQEKLVIRALNSIPEREDIEIIVIDDGSMDMTFMMVKDYIENSRKNIVLLANEENKGVGAAVNKGYDNATGDYVVLLGSDDYFLPGFNEALKELDGTDLIYFDLEINNGDKWHLSPSTKNYWCGSVKFMRKDFIGDTRCPEIRHGEDWSFYQRLLAKNPTEKYLNKAIKHYNFPRTGSLCDLKSKGKL